MRNTKLFILSFVLLLNFGCQSAGQKSSISNDQSIVQPPPPNHTDAATNQNISQAVNFKSPYQKNSRRQKILFPDDCTDSVPAGEKNWKLQTACAEALTSAKSGLQAAAKEGNCSYPIDAENNRSYEVIDDKKILSYTIKNPDETNISVITRKLGTVIESFINNNSLNFPIELKVGQELKYQKAHYEYDFEPKFYPLSPNKYVVEMRCWTAAYNLSNIYLFYDESELPAKAEVLEFPDLQFLFEEHDQEAEYPISFEKVMVKSVSGRIFNAKTKQLITLDKKTGIGYAGHYARYSFPNGKPKLVEYRAKFKEDGNGLGDDWLRTIPKTWKRYYP